MLLGHLSNGLGYYRFAYNGSNKAYVGVMAQEVGFVRPDAVERGGDGYLRVHYEKLGLSSEAAPHWQAYQQHAPKGEWVELAKEFSE